MEKIQKPLQKLLFSATLTQNPEKLAPLRLYRPKYFTVSKPATDNDGNNNTFEVSLIMIRLHESLAFRKGVKSSKSKKIVLP